MSSTGGEKSIPQGRITRLGRVTGMYTRLGTKLAGAAGRMALGSSRQDAADAFHREAAQTIRVAFGRMKGLPMKIGQLLSIVDHPLVPPEHRHHYKDAFEELQVLSHPMRWKVMRKVIEGDLGQSVDEAFAEFDPAPIAAASIGQVYKATLHDGRVVAVKVQYPGIAAAIRSDLKNVDMLKNALSIILRKIDVERTIDDLSARVLEECDYGCELCNQEEFQRVWSGHPEVWIPAIVPELSRDHVLVSDFVEGKSWPEILVATVGDQDARNRIGRILFKFMFRTFYAHRMFNADPHPGNYVFPEDGRIAFLDFGCVQRFDRSFALGMAAVRQGFMENRHQEPGFREIAMDALSLPAAFDDEEWAFVLEYLSCVYEPVRHPTFRYDAKYLDRFSDLSVKGGFLFARKALRKGFQEAKTPGVILLSRIQAGFTSILAALEAENDWASMSREIDEEMNAEEVETPPA